MVIERGGSYGSPVEIEPRWPRCANDADVASHAQGHRGEPCVLDGGDLLTTLGGRSGPAGITGRAFPVDLLRVVFDDRVERLAAAHVVIRGPWWSGECAVAMNAAWLGDWYLGPRSHPNDGLVDVTVGRLRWQQRLLARRRARTGTHLPHPDLRTVRSTSWEHTFSAATPALVDGQRVGRIRRVRIEVVPDAAVVAT